MRRDECHHSGLLKGRSPERLSPDQGLSPPRVRARPRQASPIACPQHPQSSSPRAHTLTERSLSPPSGRGGAGSDISEDRHAAISVFPAQTPNGPARTACWQLRPQSTGWVWLIWGAPAALAPGGHGQRSAPRAGRLQAGQHPSGPLLPSAPEFHPVTPSDHAARQLLLITLHEGPDAQHAFPPPGSRDLGGDPRAPAPHDGAASGTRVPPALPNTLLITLLSPDSNTCRKTSWGTCGTPGGSP
ncbi:unnamed protein product [Rangifer tarandus platyrhynchus]|uniref:Uncharacterized protein n=1 Tax=Rangifer tarandus platyrhynchus TaxID=3082113 RepID=A0AC59ZW24_RANTA